MDDIANESRKKILYVLLSLLILSMISTSLLRSNEPALETFSPPSGYDAQVGDTYYGISETINEVEIEDFVCCRTFILHSDNGVDEKSVQFSPEGNVSYLYTGYAVSSQYFYVYSHYMFENRTEGYAIVKFDANNLTLVSISDVPVGFYPHTLFIYKGSLASPSLTRDTLSLQILDDVTNAFYYETFDLPFTIKRNGLIRDPTLTIKDSVLYGYYSEQIHVEFVGGIYHRNYYKVDLETGDYQTWRFRSKYYEYIPFLFKIFDDQVYGEINRKYVLFDDLVRTPKAIISYRFSQVFFALLVVSVVYYNYRPDGYSNK